MKFAARLSQTSLGKLDSNERALISANFIFHAEDRNTAILMMDNTIKDLRLEELLFMETLTEWKF